MSTKDELLKANAFIEELEDTLKEALEACERLHEELATLTDCIDEVYTANQDEAIDVIIERYINTPSKANMQ